MFAIPWTVAHQAPLSMEFSRKEYWSGLPCPSPGDLLDPEIEARSPTLWADSLLSEPPEKLPISRIKFKMMVKTCQVPGQAYRGKDKGQEDAFMSPKSSSVGGLTHK